MKKSAIFIYLAVLILAVVIFTWNKVGNSNSEDYKQNEQVSAIINEFSKEYGHEFILATKEIERSLYGKWQVGNTIGYSLRYDITGGSLDYAVIEISKDQLRIQYSDKTFSDPFTRQHDNPIFAYYQETLNQMKQDDFLDDYSGIEGLDPDTVGTVVIAMGLSSDSPDNYSYITTGFIIINDYIIAVRQSSFYQLQKIEQ
ncbi:hypothetical protein [Lacrimispora sp.]|jgi:hypothetical protein|uniref:hypothetical protein n=1 Tax=Lacrimispora sp. TaxID=2719234 RepID=UPI0028A1E864|nr:hypothetical protein [Lacrimispora sp.]